MKQDRWYKESHVGLISQGSAASCIAFLHWFQREPCVLSAPWKCLAPCRTRPQTSLFIYLFDLPLPAAHISHVAAQRWDDDPPLLAAQILSGPLPISASTWYTHSKKGLFQQLVTKGRKWEWSSPFALTQRDNVGMAALPHHTFLLVASSCMGHRPVDVACRDVHSPRKLGCQ